MESKPGKKSSTEFPRTVTIGSSTYAMLISAYEKNKVKLLERENIRTATEYARSRLIRGIEEDTLEGRFEIVAKRENSVDVMDYYEGMKTEVAIELGKGASGTMDVFCRHDASGDCDHVGFVLADADVIKRAQELGVKLRKAEQPDEVQEALRLFDVLANANEDEVVEEGSFVRALVRSGGFTRKEAESAVQRLLESDQVYAPRPNCLKRLESGSAKKGVRMAAER
jgi:hypothetical protein